MLLPPFEFAAPASLGEACALLAAGGARLMAGGTDLLVKLKRGDPAPRLVVSLGRVPDLDTVTRQGDGGLRIGARTTIARLADAAELTGAWAALAEGAASIAGPLVRNRATVGGNIVSARPCADTVPPLMVVGARLHLTRAAGTRVVELDGFIQGPGASAIGADEVLAAIELPPPAGPAGSAYCKLGRRAAMEITIAGCAAGVALDADRRTVVQARVVLTSVAPVPLRVPDAEAALAGQAPTAALLEAAAAAVRRTATPIDDMRAGAAYRDAVIGVLARRALHAAVERAGGRVA